MRSIDEILATVLRESSEFVQSPRIIESYENRAFNPLTNEETAVLQDFVRQNIVTVSGRCVSVRAFDAQTGIKELISFCRNTFYKQGGVEVNADGDYSSKVYEMLAEGLQHLRKAITRPTRPWDRQKFQNCARTIYGEQIIQFGVICSILYQKNNFNQRRIIPDYLTFFTANGFFGYRDDSAGWDIDAWARLAEDAVSRGFPGTKVIKRIDQGVMIGETAKMLLGVAPIVQEIQQRIKCNAPTRMDQLDALVAACVDESDIARAINADAEVRRQIFETVRNKSLRALISEKTQKLKKKILNHNHIRDVISIDAVVCREEDVRAAVIEHLASIPFPPFSESDVENLVSQVLKDVRGELEKRQKPIIDILLECLDAPRAEKSSDFLPYIAIDGIYINDDDEEFPSFLTSYTLKGQFSAKQFCLLWPGNEIPPGTWGDIHIFHGNLRSDIRIKSVDFINGKVHFQLKESFQLPIALGEQVDISIGFDGFEQHTYALSHDFRQDEFILFDANGRTRIDGRNLRPKRKEWPVGSYALVRNPLDKGDVLTHMRRITDATAPDGMEVWQFTEPTTIPTGFIHGCDGIEIVGEPLETRNDTPESAPVPAAAAPLSTPLPQPDARQNAGGQRSAGPMARTLADLLKERGLLSRDFDASQSNLSLFFIGQPEGPCPAGATILPAAVDFQSFDSPDALNLQIRAPTDVNVIYCVRIGDIQLDRPHRLGDIYQWSRRIPKIRYFPQVAKLYVKLTRRYGDKIIEIPLTIPAGA